MLPQTLKIVNSSPHPDPVYAHKGDSGFDLRCWIKEEDIDDDKKSYRKKIVLEPFERRLFHTGIYLGIPKGTEIQIRSRSGMALNNGIIVLNTPGTVDSTYVNEIKVILYNASTRPVTIEDGDRIAQAVLMPVYSSEYVELVKVDKIEENNDRNLNGFGSTGVK